MADIARTPTELMETYLTEVGLKGRLELIPVLAHEDMLDEANAAFGGPPGRDGLVAHVKGFRKNVTDLSMTVDKIVSGEDQVMAQWSFSGRHTGPWMGRTPTGREITGTVFSFFDLRDGWISRYRLWLCAEMDETVVFDSSKAAGGAR